MDLVTGGTGFVGAHVVRALLARGASVRCLVRCGSRRDNLAGLPVEIAEGDLTDPASLARAVSGIATLYHCAADYRLWSRDPSELHRANVGGSLSVLVENRRGDGGLLVGYDRAYLRVELPGGDEWMNQVVPVRAVAYRDGRLRAEPLP